MIELIQKVAILLAFGAAVVFFAKRYLPEGHPLRVVVVGVATAIGAAIGYLMDLGNGVFW